MMYTEKNPEVVEAFSYLIDEEPEWYTELKSTIYFVHSGRDYIETKWGVSQINKGTFICRTPNSKSVWTETSEEFLSKYKPLNE